MFVTCFSQVSQPVMSKVKITVNKIEHGQLYKLFFSIIREGQFEGCSEDINFSDLAMVRFKFKGYAHVNTSFATQCSISLKKHDSAKIYVVKMNITCEELEYSQQLICTENWTDWISMGTKLGYNTGISNVFLYNLGMSMIVSKVKPITFAQLYDEVDFCDFHLSTADNKGSVAVHKLCLIAYSSFFKRMFSNDWRETTDNRIEIKDVTVRTLQHLKDYIYLNTLPDDDETLRRLLLLGKCYLVENLAEECIAKLALTVKPENMKSLQDFAWDNKIPDLLSGTWGTFVHSVNHLA